MSAPVRIGAERSAAVRPSPKARPRTSAKRRGTQKPTHDLPRCSGGRALSQAREGGAPAPPAQQPSKNSFGEAHPCPSSRVVAHESHGGERQSEEKMHSAAAHPHQPSPSLPSRRPHDSVQVPAGAVLPTHNRLKSLPAKRAKTPPQRKALSVSHPAEAAAHHRAVLRCSAVGGAVRQAVQRGGRGGADGRPVGSVRRPQKRQGSPRQALPVRRTDNATTGKSGRHTNLHRRTAG